MEEDQVLESWKEIASFLGRDVRTCMRWERDLGLPIHRLDASPRARVFAFKDELTTWRDQKLHASEPGTAGASGPDAAPRRPAATPSFRFRIVALTALGAIALAIVGYRAVVPTGPSPLPAGYVPPVLAILAFENNSGEAALDYWRFALAELLGTELSQSPYIRVVTTDEMLTALRRLGLTDAAAWSSEDIARIALQTHAGFVVVGSFLKAGPTIALTARLQETGSGRTASPAVRLVARSESDLIPKIDKLAGRIKRSLPLTRAQIAYDFAKEAREAVTPSPQALHAYIEGRRLQLADRWDEAAASMQRAIAIDPGFAMAYRTLAVAHRDLGHYAQARSDIGKALELADRLPRGEDRLIEGMVAFWDQDYAKAIGILESLLAAYPGHLNAMTYLGYSCGEIGRLDRAIELQTAVIRQRETVLDVRTLAGYLQRKGRYQEATELCLSYLQHVEDAWDVRQMLVYGYAFLGELDLALAEAQKNYRLRPRTAGDLGEVLVFRGDLDAAEALVGPQPYAVNRGRFAANVEYARLAVERAMAGGSVDEEAAAERRWALALEKAGRYAEAAATFGDYLKLASSGTDLPYYPSRRKQDLFVKGRLEVERGLRDEATRTAAELRAAIDAGLDPRELRYVEYILGLIELAKGIPLGAAGFFELACDRLDGEDYRGGEQALFYDGLARAQFESGDLGAAGRTYAKIILLTTGRRDDGDIFARAHYHLGRIAERKGEAAAARGFYRKFLTLWREADPGLPEVAEAAARVKASAGAGPRKSS